MVDCFVKTAIAAGCQAPERIQFHSCHNQTTICRSADSLFLLEFKLQLALFQQAKA
jgi:hypothetical protein